MGCCLGGCLRLLFFTFWRLALAALTAIVLARVDDYVEGSEHRDAVTGRAWRAYRARGGDFFAFCCLTAPETTVQ